MVAPRLLVCLGLYFDPKLGTSASIFLRKTFRKTSRRCFLVLTCQCHCEIVYDLGITDPGPETIRWCYTSMQIQFAVFSNHRHGLEHFMASHWPWHRCAFQTTINHLATSKRLFEQCTPSTSFHEGVILLCIFGCLACEIFWTTIHNCTRSQTEDLRHIQKYGFKFAG